MNKVQNYDTMEQLSSFFDKGYLVKDALNVATRYNIMVNCDLTNKSDRFLDSRFPEYVDYHMSQSVVAHVRAYVQSEYMKMRRLEDNTVFTSDSLYSEYDISEVTLVKLTKYGQWLLDLVKCYKDLSVVEYQEIEDDIKQRLID